MTLFADTSAWYAASDRGDRHNRAAAEILSSGERLVTTDHVIIETWLLIRGRSDRTIADRFWNGLRAGAASVEMVGPADLEVAWSIGEGFPDQDFSIVDRTSFAVMQRLGLTRVVSFDFHFSVYRYGPKRESAFDVVRAPS